MIEQKSYNPEKDPRYNSRRFGPGERFQFEHSVIDETDILIKKGKKPELFENLDRELLWAEFMESVDAQYPDAHLRSPRIIDIDQDRTEIIMESVNAPLLIAEHQLGSLDPDRFSRFVKTFEIFDQVGDKWKSECPRDDSNEHTPYNQLDKSWSEWYKYTRIAGLVNPKIDADARQLVVDYTQYVTPRMQHGDYKPCHIFEDGDEWIVFDAEHASETKPRYYDLAYMYARTFVLARDPDTAKRLLSEFVEQHHESKEDFFNAFLPILMSRSMGMFLDVFIAATRLNFGYKTYVDDLYKHCMQRNLQALISRQE